MLRKLISSRFKIIYLAGSVAVFLAAISALGGRTRESTPVVAPKTAVQTSQPAFTLTTARTIARANEKERLLSTQQRFQRSDGIFKLVQTHYTPQGATEGVQTYLGFIGL